jgi:MoaA/NifB/PqqE/SkfB family radical SAM enzyme
MITRAEGAAPPVWLRRLDSRLRRCRVPVRSMSALDRAVDITLESEGQTMIVEIRPGSEPGPCFRTVGRHRISYRAPSDLSARNRRLLAYALEVVARLESLLPERHRGSAAIGEAVEDPAASLHRRFPFAFVERSSSGDRTQTEVLVRLTTACNQRCPFCSAPPTPEPSDEALTDCLGFVSTRIPEARVTLTGGEPTLRRRFCADVAAVLSCPEIRALQVQTNAVALASGERLAELHPDPRLSFFVSLHAIDTDIYDRCTGTSGQLPLALAGIRTLLSGGHRVVLNTVASSANLEHLGSMAEGLPALFPQRPLPGWHFSVLICPDGRPEAAEFLVRYSVLAPAIEAAAERAAGLGIAVEPLVSSTHAALPLCVVGQSHRQASARRPRPEAGETGYEDFARPWVKAARCRRCAAADHCLGVPAPYALRFGLEELSPFGAPPGAPASGRDSPAPQDHAPAPRSRPPRMLPVPETVVRMRPAGSEIRCVRPWTTLEIADPSGDARQCCADWTPAVHGSLRESGLAEIWNGPSYRAARRAMGAGGASLCLPVCPRFQDGTLSESRLQIAAGSERFVRNQILLAEDIAGRRDETRAMPLYLVLCPSSYCNADCVMCLHGREPRRDLPDGLWEELPSLLPTLQTLTLLGGEPFANPRVWQLLREIDVAVYPDLSLDLVTNGSLLSEHALRQVRRAAFGGVTISLNAGTAEVFERVQRGLRFDDVIANLDALLRFRDEHPRWFGVTLSFVVQPLAAHTLVEFGEIAHARDLHIRLLPLTVPRIPELDFYGDADVVARVVEDLDRFRAWVDRTRPAWATEVEAVRRAIQATHAERAGA